MTWLEIIAGLCIVAIKSVDAITKITMPSKTGSTKNDDGEKEKNDFDSKEIDTTKQSGAGAATAKESDDSPSAAKKTSVQRQGDEDDPETAASVTKDRKDDENENQLYQKKSEEEAEEEEEEDITASANKGDEKKPSAKKSASNNNNNKKRKSAPSSPTVRDLRERKTTVNYNPVDFFEVMTKELDDEHESPKSTTTSSKKKKKKKTIRIKKDTDHHETSVPKKDPKDDENDKELEPKKSEEEEGEDVSPSSSKGKKKSKAASKKRKSAPSPTTTVRDLRERKPVILYNPVVGGEVFERIGDGENLITDKPAENGPPQPGRGIRLSGLDHVKEAINAAGIEDLMMAYRFVYWKSATTKVKMSKKDVKQSILAFSGYLPIRNPKLSKAEQAEVDEEFEVIMGQKAYKLTVPQLKKLCDTFGIDRRGMSGNKEDLVNCLLDFLGEPVTMDKFEKIRSSSTASKKKKKNPEDEERSADDDNDETKENANESIDDNKSDDFWEDAMLVDGAEVSDKTLRLWVRAFVRCHNIKSTTLKQAVTIATEKFGVDMSEKTLQIKDLLVEEA